MTVNEIKRGRISTAINLSLSVGKNCVTVAIDSLLVARVLSKGRQVRSLTKGRLVWFFFNFCYPSRVRLYAPKVMR